MGPKGSKEAKKKHNAKKQKNKQIEEELQIEQEEVRNQVNILVLGTGESGKSTFIKQLLILHKGGFRQTDRETYFTTIRKNLVIHTVQMVNACKSFGWELEEKNHELAREFVNIKTSEIKELKTDTVTKIKQLWEDPALKTAFKNRNKFHLPDSSDYYLDDIDRIGDPKYSPTDRDILLCRIPTTGLNKISFNFGETPWNVVDVGGQRSERRKWIHQFDNVTLLIYPINKKYKIILIKIIQNFFLLTYYQGEGLGIFQEDPLSPIIFALISHFLLLKIIPTTDHCQMFADDLILIKKGNIKQINEKLNSIY
ncbi:guanine nucleotide-binding protein g(o) subunit alpha [Anaeramoeba flamelloides]|uniref:Guanine nucleotide-binding protein g(O) subunit alpha n=1 Tax=Anaeramoeba flamelloides TaxID=1746091 RepID=A0ABQ8X9L4_9EUKA|nr:guanine nucleotide-binding protein g(o) subunit alpha [Anaeramoeba flamelloides]